MIAWGTVSGTRLLQNALTAGFGLRVLILLFGPVSGAHLNPVVSAVDWAIGRRARTALTGSDLLAYKIAQLLGGRPPPSAHSALRITATSMPSCSSAPNAGGRRPNAATAIAAGKKRRP